MRWKRSLSDFPDTVLFSALARHPLLLVFNVFRNHDTGKCANCKDIKLNSPYVAPGTIFRFKMVAGPLIQTAIVDLRGMFRMKNETEAGRVINLPDELDVLRRENTKLKEVEPILEEVLNQLEGKYRAASDEMERRMQERTSALEKANKDLEEANVALRVLLNRQTEDNKKLEERLHVNIEELVVPYLEKLKQAGLNGRYQDYLTLLEANLNDIVSPFIQNISAVYRNLTPTEIRVAEMIKQGKASKDIAEILNSSVGTINTHRNNIRKKLNLRKQNKNLRSYLLTLG